MSWCRHVSAGVFLTLAEFTRSIPNADRLYTEYFGLIDIEEVTVRTKRKALYYGHKSEVSVIWDGFTDRMRMVDYAENWWKCDNVFLVFWIRSQRPGNGLRAWCFKSGASSPPDTFSGKEAIGLIRWQVINLFIALFYSLFMYFIYDYGEIPGKARCYEKD